MSAALANPVKATRATLERRVFCISSPLFKHKSIFGSLTKPQCPALACSNPLYPISRTLAVSGMQQCRKLRHGAQRIAGFDHVPKPHQAQESTELLSILGELRASPVRVPHATVTDFRRRRRISRAGNRHHWG